MLEGNEASRGSCSIGYGPDPMGSDKAADVPGWDCAKSDGYPRSMGAGMEEAGKTRNPDRTRSDPPMTAATTELSAGVAVSPAGDPFQDAAVSVPSIRIAISITLPDYAPVEDPGRFVAYRDGRPTSVPAADPMGTEVASVDMMSGTKDIRRKGMARGMRCPERPAVRVRCYANGTA